MRVVRLPQVVRVRAVLADIPDYAPGRDADTVARERGLDEAVKLASNEAPFPPPAAVQRAVADAVSGVHRYPDDAGRALRERLAQRRGCEPGEVVLGNGSVALCQQALLATIDPGDEALWCWPSFEAYPILGRQAGAAIVAPPLRAHRYALDAMADAITERTRIVFVCNPNNPTGTVVHAGELDELLDRVPGDVLVVLDEAYREFVRDEAVADGVDLAREHPNVLVLRTFSKAYGLAGLRIGYGIGSHEIVAALRRTRQPFGVNALAQAAALAALDSEAEVASRIELLVAERTRVTEALRADVGIDVPDSQANFVWLPLETRATDVVDACEQHGVVLRPFPGHGVRVTIGTPTENDRMLEVVAGVLGGVS
jgi:histidinol-phosphate aminotransferase